MKLRGVILFILIAWGLSSAVVVPKPVAIQDSALLRWVLQPDFSSGLLPSGAWSMSPVSDGDLTLILFRDGTEYKRLSPQFTAQLLATAPDLFSDTLSKRQENQRPSLQMVKPYWDWIGEPMDRLDGVWFQQSEGLDVGRSGIGSRGQRWWIQDQAWIRVAKIFGSTRAALSFRSSSDYMNIQRELREYYGTSDYSDYSWSLALTWRAFTYEIQSSPYVLPEYYWLEPSVDSLWEASKRGDNAHSDGKVVSMFKNASESSLATGYANNVAHLFEARLWHLRYRILFDNDMYSAPVHRFGFEDLQTSIGTWGAFAVGCGNVWVPGFWFEAGPAFSWKVPMDMSWDHIAWFPLRFEMMYENTSHFRLAFSTRLHLGGK